jgi:2-octaprenyl-6-methoxyphenol hydroxylase
MNVIADARADVMIVGGGLVGASLALALTHAGVATTLVESRAAAQALADPARERFLALARASVNALAGLGVWPDLAAHAAPIAAVHVSRRGGFGRALLRARDHGVDRFGAVIPASRLGLALESGLLRAPMLTRIVPATLQDFDVGRDHVDVVLSGEFGEHRMTTSLLVGADGAESFVRTHAGFAIEREAYGQDAMVQSIGLSRDHDGVAYERFTGDGAIALLPLPGRRAGLVWTLPHERADELAARSGPDWLDLLQSTFGHRLGRFHSPGQRVRYPLTRSFVRDTVRGRVVLVGNAAQSLHPVAAQGFNLGLRDALVLAEEIAAMKRGLRDSAASASVPDGALLPEVGNPWPAQDVAHMLGRHVDRRRADRTRITALSHGLARWPKVDAPGVGLVRAAMFAALNAAPGVRESLVLAAMGFAGDVPDLALDPVA